MNITNEQYQRLCDVANISRDNPSINELISAFQLQRFNLIACTNTMKELRAEVARLTAKLDVESSLLRDYSYLLGSVATSPRGSIGSFGNTYLPQLNAEWINKMYTRYKQYCQDDVAGTPSMQE